MRTMTHQPQYASVVSVLFHPVIQVLFHPVIYRVITVIVVVVVVVVGGTYRVFDGGVFSASAYKITGRRSIHSSAGSTVARAAKHNFAGIFGLKGRSFSCRCHGAAAVKIKSELFTPLD